MSSFDHQALMQSINTQLGPFRKAQGEAMQGFGQLARASMAAGQVSALHKELMALAIGVSQRCSGCIAFHTKALVKLGWSSKLCQITTKSATKATSRSWFR